MKGKELAHKMNYKGDINPGVHTGPSLFGAGCGNKQRNSENIGMGDYFCMALGFAVNINVVLPLSPPLPTVRPLEVS